MKALIVDDSRTIRSVLGRMLKGLGCEVCEAGNGREALDVLKATSGIDFALVDWNMPVMDGYEFLCAVKADAALSPLRILMVTTESESARVESALAAGASEYLMKPFSPEAVVEKLALMGIEVG